MSCFKLKSVVLFLKIFISLVLSRNFDDIIKLEDFYIDNMLVEEKSHENILIYNILYKTFIGSKLLRIRFDKVDRIIGIYDELDI